MGAEATLTLDEARADAREAGLRYVSDQRPGIRRVRWGEGFRYIGPDGRAVRDPETLARIRALAIPPAWESVWICPRSDGHVQATGRDARGRKQSRYHARWRAVRDENKYHRLLDFARALPRIRERVERDLALPGLPREKVLAAVVRLLETTHIRVGNPEYARQNHSYGLTTMRQRHVEVNGSKIRFSFQGKSRIHHTVNLQDRRLAAILRRCSELPGYELFHYVEPDGTVRAVGSGEVNEYLREISGEAFTAKEFRTWAGTLLACRELGAMAAAATAAESKRNIAHAMASVARELRNTATVCRKCYVHPAVIEAYAAGVLGGAQEPPRAEAEAAALAEEERAMVALLRRASGR